MLIRRNANFNANTTATYAIDEPDECPLCHFSIKPVKLHTHGYFQGSDKFIADMYLCNHCHKPFIALFKCKNATVQVEGINTLKAELE